MAALMPRAQAPFMWMERGCPNLACTGPLRAGPRQTRKCGRPSYLFFMVKLHTLLTQSRPEASLALMRRPARSEWIQNGATTLGGNRGVGVWRRPPAGAGFGGGFLAKFRYLGSAKRESLAAGSCCLLLWPLLRLL
jgi:hypothetical protein